MHISSDLLDAFPLATRYRALTTGLHEGMIREAGAGWRVFPYRERHLQCVWADDSIRPEQLRSAAGEEVTVVSPGTWNLEAGPDFLDAILVLGPERRRVTGDVEVHIRPADWATHAHGEDPRYSRVVSHVTYFPGRGHGASLPAGVVEIPLRDALRKDPSFGFEDLDITSYPYAVLPASRRPCADALAGKSPDFHEELLVAAGEERIRLKAVRMATRIAECGREQALYEETMCALGYKHNRTGFRRLARALPVDVLRGEAAGSVSNAYSLMLGVAGLMPAVPGATWPPDARRFVRGLWDLWWKQNSRWDSQCLPPGSWRLAGVRPQNHPRRRLAAAAALFVAGVPLTERLAALDTGSPDVWFDRARGIFTGAGSSGFWGRHLSLSGKATTSQVALVGGRRAAAILSNVVLPFFAATGGNVTHLLEGLPPEQDNSIIRRTAFALFSRDHNPAMYESGLRQQGILQIFHDFCLPDRSACADCRLVRALDGAGERA